QSLTELGFTHLAWGERDAAEVFWRRAEEQARRTQAAGAAFWPLEIEAVKAILAGDLPQAVRLRSAIQTLGESIGRAPAGRQRGAAVTRPALYYLGDYEEALATIPAVPGLRATGGNFSSQRCFYLALAGRLTEAAVILDQFLGLEDIVRPNGATNSFTL